VPPRLVLVDVPRRFQLARHGIRSDRCPSSSAKAARPISLLQSWPHRAAPHVLGDALATAIFPFYYFFQRGAWRGTETCITNGLRGIAHEAAPRKGSIACGRAMDTASALSRSEFSRRNAPRWLPSLHLCIQAKSHGCSARLEHHCRQRGRLRSAPPGTSQQPPDKGAPAVRTIFPPAPWWRTIAGKEYNMTHQGCIDHGRALKVASPMTSNARNDGFAQLGIPRPSGRRTFSMPMMASSTSTPSATAESRPGSMVSGP